MYREYRALMDSVDHLQKFAYFQSDNDLQRAEDQMVSEVMSVPRKNYTFGNPAYRLAEQQYLSAARDLEKRLYGGKPITSEQRSSIRQQVRNYPQAKPFFEIIARDRNELANHPKAKSFQARYGYNPFLEY